MTVSPFDAALNVATDADWQKAVQEADAGGDSHVDASIYLAAFGTPAGRMVLEDLYNRFVNVTRAMPGEAEGSAFYREGMAQVVFDVMMRCEIAAKGEQDDD